MADFGLLLLLLLLLLDDLTKGEMLFGLLFVVVEVVVVELELIKLDDDVWWLYAGFILRFKYVGPLVVEALAFVALAIVDVSPLFKDLFRMYV